MIDDTSAPTETNLEVVSTRIFSAPREVVFEAFSNPDHLARWWGPEGFKNEFKEFDLRPGGAWRFVMHGPDGTDYDMEKEFVKVVKPERVVLQHLSPMHRFEMTMTFDEHSDGTQLTWRMLFESIENSNLIGLIAEANEQNFDRLDAHLKKKSRRR